VGTAGFSPVADSRSGRYVYRSLLKLYRSLLTLARTCAGESSDTWVDASGKRRRREWAGMCTGLF
jgi:hypothetical protein